MDSKSQTQIKICCIASLEEARLALSAGADAVGFVCAVPISKRSIKQDTVAEIIARLPANIESFLLSTETTASAITEQIRATGASTVQILSDLSTEELTQLAELIPHTRRAKVIHIEEEGALELIDSYAPYVDAFLLDSGRPSAATPEYGGTGRTHDWTISAEFTRKSPLPVYLAGGLNPDNVYEAIKTVRPNGVDLCSGVRTDGRLDPARLADFIVKVRGVDEAVGRSEG